jgi:hypothetical protein
MYAFLAFSAVVALILLLPVKLSVGRPAYLAYWLSLIYVFAIATQAFGYDTESYAKMVELYWREPLDFDVGKYMSGTALILIAKMTSGYNAGFSAIVVLLSLLPLLLGRKAYSLSFAATVFPIVIFFALGNFKLGLSLPFIYGYFLSLSNSNWKLSSAFLMAAVLMHPQNVVLAGMIPLVIFTSGERIRASTFIALLVMLGGTVFYVVSNLDTLTLFTRYLTDDSLSDEELGGGAKFKLAEAGYQFLFLGLLFFGRRELSPFRILFLGCVSYHSIRLGFSLFPFLDPSLIGRGLLPFMILDILILERAFSLQTLNRRLIYGFQMLALTRLGATLWSGSLRNAIDQHLT